VTSDTAAIPTRNDKPKILFVDDDLLALEGLSRTVHREFKADLAEGPEAGLGKVKNDGPYCVVVSDMRMPVMDGAEFLSRVRALAPDSTRVMLTGYADTEAAMRAVNEGRIFRFLNKPVTAENLTLTLRACVAQYDLMRHEKELLEKTLAGAIRVLTEMLHLANPVAFNKGARICQYVRHIAGKLGLSNTWQYEIAAMLSELGCLTLTPDLLEAIHAGKPLTPEHERSYSQHPQIAHDLLARIPRLELVAEMILQQKEVPTDFPRSLSPDAESVRRGAQMLRVSLAFDHLLRTGSERHDALLALSRNPVDYDVQMVAALEDFRLSRGPTELRNIDVRDLCTGMILNQPLLSTTGTLLAAKGHEVSPALLKAVRNFIENGTVKGAVLVTVGAGETWVSKAAAR
jgi:response regulator RpfG family c-di-GMP phosphodiesterase